VTEGPLKANVARAPIVAEMAAVPPLQGLLASELQPALKVAAVSSKRAAAAVIGAANTRRQAR
jgi:hypothetical protein